MEALIPKFENKNTIVKNEKKKDHNPNFSTPSILAIYIFNAKKRIKVTLFVAKLHNVSLINLLCKKFKQFIIFLSVFHIQNLLIMFLK